MKEGRKEVRVEGMDRLAWDRVEPEGMGWLLFRRRGSLIYGLPTYVYCVQCTVYFRKNNYPVIVFCSLR